MTRCAPRPITCTPSAWAPCADVARTLAMFGAFTEGMSLFASFAMLLNFPRHNKMNGMGQIVSWSVRDESLHCEGITKLYHAWNEETGAVTKSVRDDIIDVAKTMVGLEERFVDLAFGLGEIQGMTPADIKSYVRYIADWRLTQLKLDAGVRQFRRDGKRLQAAQAASAALAGGNPQRRRARQFLRAARHRIFQGRDQRQLGRRWRGVGRISTSATRSRQSSRTKNRGRGNMISLGYATVGSNKLDQAKKFYDALFEPHGVKSAFEHPSGGRVYGKDGGIFFGVLGPYDKNPATAGNGAMAAFNLGSRDEVNAFHAKALELGGADEGAPGERGPGFYFSYFRDLDGNKLCAYHIG